ncbi:MAG: cyclic nucleotide-binding domain-containing protein, partial [Myxococcota bacterium]
MTVFYLFGKFCDQDIDWMIGVGTRKDVAAGEVLIRAGETVESFYISLSGQFGVTAESKLIASIAPGEAIGDLSFLDRRPP